MTKMEPPYDGAKDMILVENVDDRDFLTELFKAMYDELPESRKKEIIMRGYNYGNDSKPNYA